MRPGVRRPCGSLGIGSILREVARSEELTEWFYNIRTGKVEEGRQSIASDLDGPFATRQEAEHAPEIIAERSRKWASEDSDD
jgi:hypothetical protein